MVTIDPRVSPRVRLARQSLGLPGSTLDPGHTRDSGSAWDPGGPGTRGPVQTWLHFWMAIMCFLKPNRKSAIFGVWAVPGAPEAFQKVGGFAPHLQWKGLPGPRGRSDPQNDRCSTLENLKFPPKVQPRKRLTRGGPPPPGSVRRRFPPGSSGVVPHRRGRFTRGGPPPPGSSGGIRGISQCRHYVLSVMVTGPIDKVQAKDMPTNPPTNKPFTTSW